MSIWKIYFYDGPRLLCAISGDHCYAAMRAETRAPIGYQLIGHI